MTHSTNITLMRKRKEEPESNRGNTWGKMDGE